MKEDSAKKLIDSVFTHSFDKDRFKQFIVELFNDFQFQGGSYTVWKEYQEFIESYERFGTYTDKEKNKIEILTVKLRKSPSRDRARTMQRNFIAKFLKNGNKDAALVAFYGEDPSDWRFSFVKMEYRIDLKENGKIDPVEEFTPAKRFSFLVGEHEPNHTCRRQFWPLIIQEKINPTLKDIEECFSIENVTQEFFDEYKKLFLDLQDSLEKALAKNPIGLREFQDKKISTVDFSKKLMGQIVFLYFLQKKGWLGIEKDPQTGQFYEWGSGPRNFMRSLFEKKIVPYDNFFNDILEPLFYEALAENRANDFYSRFKCKIPFLNGGLFEPINDYNWTSSNILLDNSIFEHIFEIFGRFNFTIKEDEPLEREVAIDPEVLGKVFENLLEIKDRKSRGAFYTPREIVHYMCQQSLIGYLENNTSIPREDLEIFVRLGDFALGVIIQEQADIHQYGRIVKKNQKFTLPESIQQNFDLLDQLLKDVKIIDPAVGSGAFPVGMMSEIVKARSILTPFFQTGKSERTNYELKRATIENSLYGVDIDSSAVDIAKLRFWLSLIVDEENIKNIRPLPNLDHKIMCGNSLVEEFEGVKLFDDSMLGEPEEDRTDDIALIDARIETLGQKLNAISTGKEQTGDSKSIKREIEKLRNEKRSFAAIPQKDESQWTIDQAVNTRLKKSRHKLSELKRYQKLFFNEQNRNSKKEYRNCIDKLEWDLIEETLKEEGNTDACKKLAEYRKNKSKPFFLWKLYFAEIFQRVNPGFDIVIANPPYVRQEKINVDFKDYAKKHYQSYSGRADIYVYFIEQSHKLIRMNGIFCFICANKFIKEKYGTKIRNFLTFNAKLREIIDFGELPVFKSASTFPSIILTNKKSVEIQSIIFAQIDRLDYRSLSEEIEIKKITLDNDAIEGSNWSLSNPENFKITKKIQSKGIPLCEFSGSKILSGIKTGLNRAFIINNEIKNCLVADDIKSQEVIKPLLVGNDIRNYRIDFDNNYLLYMPHGVKIDQYPAVKKYLEKFKEDLKNRALDQKWFELQQPQFAYKEYFEKSKIIWPDIAKESRFSLDNTGFYLDMTCFFVPSEDLYLLGILNSKLSWLYLKEHSPVLGDKNKKGRLRLKKSYIEHLPIHSINPNDPTDIAKHELIIKFVNQILHLNNKLQNTSSKQEKAIFLKQIEESNDLIDTLVFELYGLTEEEIRYVKENVKF